MNAMKAMKAMLHDRCSHASAFFDNNVYVAGGYKFEKKNKMLQNTMEK